MLVIWWVQSSESRSTGSHSMVHNVEGLTCRQQRFCARTLDSSRWGDNLKPGASSANDVSSFGFRLPTGVHAWIFMVCKPRQTMTICLWSIVLRCLPRLKHFFCPSWDRVASVPLGRLPPWVLRTATHSSAQLPQLRRTAPDRHQQCSATGALRGCICICDEPRQGIQGRHPFCWLGE